MQIGSVVGRCALVVGLAMGAESMLVEPAAADPRVDYAPLLLLQSDETHWPMSATTFVNHSSLKWRHHDNCEGTEHLMASMESVNSA